MQEWVVRLKDGYPYCWNETDAQGGICQGLSCADPPEACTECPVCWNGDGLSSYAPPKRDGTSKPERRKIANRQCCADGDLACDLDAYHCSSTKQACDPLNPQCPGTETCVFGPNGQCVFGIGMCFCVDDPSISEPTGTQFCDDSRQFWCVNPPQDVLYFVDYRKPVPARCFDTNNVQTKHRCFVDPNHDRIPEHDPNLDCRPISGGGYCPDSDTVNCGANFTCQVPNDKKWEEAAVDALEAKLATKYCWDPTLSSQGTKRFKIVGQYGSAGAPPGPAGAECSATTTTLPTGVTTTTLLPLTQTDCSECEPPEQGCSSYDTAITDGKCLFPKYVHSQLPNMCVDKATVVVPLKKYPTARTFNLKGRFSPSGVFYQSANPGVDQGDNLSLTCSWSACQ
jgi:hypothetical protein